jgi:hypothetical protein
LHQEEIEEYNEKMEGISSVILFDKNKELQPPMKISPFDTKIEIYVDGLFNETQKGVCGFLIDVDDITKYYKFEFINFNLKEPKFKLKNPSYSLKVKALAQALEYIQQFPDIIIDYSSIMIYVNNAKLIDEIQLQVYNSQKEEITKKYWETIKNYPHSLKISKPPIDKTIELASKCRDSMTNIEGGE